jgi:protein O-GlcNAc transferase
VALGQVQWCNFHLAYQGEDDLALQSRYGDWLGRYVDSVDPALRSPLPHRLPGSRIRVGFASRFFSRTTVGSYFGRWVTGLDRRRFEVFVFDFAPGEDEVAAAIAARADARYALSPRAHSLPAIAAAIRGSALDVLVYPELGMHDVAYTLAGMRLARVQCCGWGHPVTTGHATIDWYLSAAAMEPAGAGAHYRERLAGLPGIGTSYPRPPQAARARRADFGLPDGRTLLLCPQSLFKIHPDNDALFADVLAAVPAADLVLFEAAQPRITAAFRQRLSAALAARGVDAGTRLRVLPVVPRETYLALTATCDLVLDTLRWSGGNTSLDALASSLPLVTLPGRFMRARQSTAMLRQLDLPQLVAADRDDYLRIAVELASERGLRTDVARAIAARSDRLFDDATALAAWAGFVEAVATGAEPGSLRIA